jgi:Glycoside hydrolase family 44
MDEVEAESRYASADTAHRRQSSELPPGISPGALLPRRSVYTHPRVLLRRRFPVPVVVPILLIALAAVSTRFIAGYYGTSGLLTVRVEDQQAVSLDLREAFPRSSTAFGVNVFPPEATKSADGAYGFMSYDAATYTGLKDVSMSLLRFPGGEWGEAHTPSIEQTDAFLALANRVHAAAFIQVRLRGGTPQQAADLVRYTNVRSASKGGTSPNAPFTPVHLWAIGNEPDLRGPNYTVANYVSDFIAFANAMLAVDPTIKIYGPELSQFNGVESGPLDSQGVPWLDGFLRGIAEYEQQSGKHILGGISVHRYPFATGIASAALLFASANEWQYNLPPLRDEIHRLLKDDLPIAITELNATAFGGTTVDPYFTALWWADTVGVLLEERVETVDFFSARGLEQPYPLLTLQGNPTPMYRVLELYREMLPNVIPIGTETGQIHVYAATNNARETVSVMFVNESAYRADARIDADQFVSQLVGRWRGVQIELPRYAIVCVVLQRAGAAHSYSYNPLDPNLAAGQSGDIILRRVP